MPTEPEWGKAPLLAPQGCAAGTLTATWVLLSAGNGIARAMPAAAPGLPPQRLCQHADLPA